MIRFHKEGHSIIIFNIILLVILNIIFYYYSKTILYPILFNIISIIYLFIILQFFRNPIRKIIENDKHIYAPADGKIVVINKVNEDEFFNDKMMQISIFMSPINVHVNRYPISGEIIYAKHHPGKYLVAWHPKSSKKNEHTSIVVKNQKTTIMFRQIAGYIARRIIMYSKKGNYANQGDDFGFIKFGSRVDLFLPLNAKLNISLGEKVTGNKTIIAYV